VQLSIAILSKKKCPGKDARGKIVQNPNCLNYIKSKFLFRITNRINIQIKYIIMCIYYMLLKTYLQHGVYEKNIQFIFTFFKSHIITIIKNCLYTHYLNTISICKTNKKKHIIYTNIYYNYLIKIDELT